MPVDVMNVEFGKAWRGYAAKEVDNFLAQVADAYADALRETAQARERAAELEKRVARYHESEETLQRALTLAEKAADEVRHNAHHEAEVILREAEAEGRRLAETARAQVAGAAREVQALREQRDRFEAEMRGLMQTFTELLDRRRTDEVAAPAPHGAEPAPAESP